MKTIKVSEATELQLDWLVAKCESNPVARHNTGAIFLIDTPWADKSRLKWLAEYSPTRHWAQGGPIIERDGISLYRMTSDWIAAHAPTGDGPSGPTPLVAAMRCYVTSKLGDTVEVPEELA